MTVTATWNTTDLVAKDKAHLVHPVSNLHQLREHGPLVLAHADDVWIWDTDGNRYLDSFAGLWNINAGHGRRELAEAASRQMQEVAFVPNFFGLASPPAIELAAKLAEIFPGDLNHFQFTSGGGESNETAIKMARYYWHLKGQAGKIKVLSRKMGYHGIATAALAATGIPAYHDGFGPLAPGFIHLSPPFQYRFGLEGQTEAEFIAMLVQELEETIAREGADTIAAMIAEPVQGAGGVVVPPQDYWQAIAPVLKANNILLIFDEVINGFGRTGTMFGMEQYDIVPDIASFAKGITSGYVPLGGVGITDDVFDVLSAPDKMFMHGFTYSGHPLACAVALPNIRIIEEENLPANAAHAGDYLLGRLSGLLDRPYVGNVRGKGLMTFVEVVADKESKSKFEPSFNVSGKLTAATRKHGIIVRPVAEGIAIAPPLTIREPELDFLADAIGAALTDVFEG